MQTERQPQEHLVSVSQFTATAGKAADQIAALLNGPLRYVILILFTGLYFYVTCDRASRKTLWFDEIFTLYISRLPDMSAVWTALTKGADFNPPGFYALTRLSESLVGENNVGLRLPEIIGFWVFCLSLFRFVSVRTSPLCGFVSMSFPLATRALFYATEARPHGIVIGLYGLALISWQAASKQTTRRLWHLCLLGLSVAGAMLTHTYSLMVLLVIGLGETVRTLRTRRIEWSIWITLFISSTAILVSIPLRQAARSFLGPGFFPPGLRRLAEAYQFHLAPAAGTIGILLVLLSLGLTFRRRSQPEGKDYPRPNAEELVAALAFVLLPVFAFVLARVTGSPFFPRYTIATIGGFGCLAGFGMARRPELALTALLIIWAQIGLDFQRFRNDVVVLEPESSLAISTYRPDLIRIFSWIEEAGTSELPVALTDYHEFATLFHYAPPRLRSRLTYFDWDLDGKAWVFIQKCCGAPGRISNVTDFKRSHASFLILGTARTLKHLNDLMGAEQTATLKKMAGDRFLLLVSAGEN